MEHLCVLTMTVFAGTVVATAATPSVTFHKDVLPILQKNCQTCHRPGEVAPFSLMSYAEARPWAKAIRVAVVSQQMPPWFADPKVGHFSNERRLTEAQIATLVSWANNGAPEGDPKDAPAPLSFVDGWNIKPDLEIEMPAEFHVPATGTIDYQYMLVKTNFPEDMWVSAAEMRPGNSKVVHHGEAWIRPPGAKWMADATPGVSYPSQQMKRGPGDGLEILGKFNPGLGDQTFDFGSSAKFVPKGSDIVFEIHYTSVGTPQTSKSVVGLVLAKNPPKLRYVTSYGPIGNNLVIEPNDDNAEVVSESATQYANSKMEQWFQAAGAIQVAKTPPFVPGVSTHAYGGTRVGDSADTNVVNRWGFSHEEPNLGILGASVMGTSGARHPTLTAQALAWRTADYLVKNWKSVRS